MCAIMGKYPQRRNPMAHKHTSPRPHAEFRHRSQIPMPAVAEGEQHLAALLSPSLLAPRQLARRDPRQPHRVIRMRERLLTLPVMVAMIVRLGWRRMPAVAEVHKVLAREGLLWVAPLRGSPQASTKRLDALPAAVMGQLFSEGCARRPAQAPPGLPHPSWTPVCAHCSRLAMVDGSPLEALRQKTEALRQRAGVVLGGKMLGMVAAFSHRPLWQLYTEDAAANDKRLAAELLAMLPPGGRVVPLSDQGPRSPRAVGASGLRAVSAPLAERGGLFADQTGVGPGLLVDGLDQCGPVAAPGHPDFLCRAGDHLPTGGPGLGRTLG